MKDDGRPVPTSKPLTLREPSTIEATYHSNAGIRVGRWIIGIGGVVAGTAIWLSGGHTTMTSCPSTDLYCDPHTSVDTSPIDIGLGIVGASVLVGALLALQKDTADVSIKPRAAAANDSSTSGPREELGQSRDHCWTRDTASRSPHGAVEDASSKRRDFFFRAERSAVEPKARSGGSVPRLLGSPNQRCARVSRWHPLAIKLRSQLASARAWHSNHDQSLVSRE